MRSTRRSEPRRQFCLLLAAEMSPVRGQTHPTDPPDGKTADALLSDLQSICILILLYETSLMAIVRYFYLGGACAIRYFLVIGGWHTLTDERIITEG